MPASAIQTPFSYIKQDAKKHTETTNNNKENLDADFQGGRIIFMVVGSSQVIYYVLIVFWVAALEMGFSLTGRKLRIEYFEKFGQKIHRGAKV